MKRALPYLKASIGFEKFGKTILERLTVTNLKVLKVCMDIEYN